MSIVRHFHDWKTPALPEAVAELTRGWTGTGPLDLRDCLIVVPTRHAGRRLRAELARTAAHRKTAVLTNSIVTPEHLVPLPPGVAGESLVLALLAQRLLERHRNFPALFPATDSPWNYAFALAMSAQFQDVRRQLNETDRSIADLVPLVPDDERARWGELAQLEQDLLQDIARLGWKDPLQARLEAARQPPDPRLYSRVAVLFVPDLPALAARMLRAMSAKCQVEIHVLAPEMEKARFDDWGRPLPDHWEKLPLPLAENQIHVFEQAPEETEVLAGLLIEAHGANHALTVCTPDPGNARALERRLQMENLGLYLPNGVPLAATSPGRLLSGWLAVLRQRDYAATAAFLRHPDVQDWLCVRLDLRDAKNLLSQLDDCQAKHLPTAFDDLRRFAEQKIGQDGTAPSRIHSTTEGTNSVSSAGAHGDAAYPILAAALAEMEKHFADFLPVFLADLYDCRKPSSCPIPPDPLFSEAAKSLAGLVQATDESAKILHLNRENSIDLLVTAMALETVFPTPNRGTTRETIGWLEVQWETGPAILLADMREGIVPETRVGDAFLPDSIRAQAGMAGNRERLARDLFLAHGLLESRKTGVRFLYSRRAANQEPQLPSRLLLACPDDELPRRVDLIFGRPGIRGEAAAVPSRPVLPLKPPPCKPEWIPTSLRATDFKPYLACPFRFYLARVLGMESLDDRAREINILDFGNLAHEALRVLKKHPALADEEELKALLLGELERLAAVQFGPRPPFAAIVQLESLRMRLVAAARVHAAAVRDGWRIVSAEEKFAAELDGMLLRARLDRIDRHLETGRIRILDYKTSDSGEAPIQTHFRPNSEKRWSDLQLPLYRFLYVQLHPETPDIAVGYFTLPKATGKTGILEWDLRSKEGEDLYPEAIAKACAVIADIRAGKFWPPADKPIRFDEFEPLFSAGETLIREPGQP